MLTAMYERNYLIMKINMKLHKKFLQDWLWKPNDYDKGFWVQCVDLAKAYSKEVFWIELWNFSWWALKAWLSGSPFNSKWIRINNTSSFIPLCGDIVFFDKTASNKYGHVALINNANIKEIEVLEQNWWKGSWTWLWPDAIRLKKYNYLTPKVLGFFRFIWK